jgi:superfamily II DNA/RNA helicase
VPQHLKTGLLLELLKHTDTESILIFTRTKHRAKRIGQQLEKAGYKAASLQGNLSQNRRQEALDGFRSGKYQILVATDIAARGIDVSSISHVINYDIPDTTDAYTHRIGRTGRAAKTGDAFTFVTHEDEPVVRSIERVLGEKIERRTIKDFDYKKTAPARDSEFARPPREPRRRPEAGRPEQGRAHASAHAGPGSHRTSSQSLPGGHRGTAGVHSPAPGKRTFKPRTHRPGSAR